MGISAGDVLYELGLDPTKFEQGMKSAENRLKSLGQSMTNFGQQMSLKITAPLALMGGLAVRTAAQYSESMAKVKAVTGATAEEFEKLDEMAKHLGETTKFTAAEVASAMSFMAMAGMDTNTILASLNDTLNLAAAGALDMGAAADIVTNILAAWGMDAEELTGAVDVLAKAFTSSNTDLVMLGEAMKYAGPVAKSFGLSFEETTAIVGIFGNAGIQATMAGTALRGALVQLYEKAEQFGIVIEDANGKMLPMADILEQLEQKGLTAGEMMDLFGQRAGPAMMALLDAGSEKLRAYTADLEDAGGTAERIAETQMEGLHGALVTLKSAFEGLQLALVDAVMPALTWLIEKLTALFRWFTSLPGPVKTAMVVMASLLAVAGPLLVIFGQMAIGISGLITLFKSHTIAMIAHRVATIAATVATKAVTAAQWLWNAAMTANPIGIVIAAIAALVAGLTALAAKWKEVVAWFTGGANRARLEFERWADSIRENADQMVVDVQDAFNTWVSRTEDATQVIISEFDRQIEAARNAHAERMADLDDERAKALDNLDEETRARLEALSSERDSIDEAMEARRRAEREQRYNDQVASLQAQIAAEQDADRRADLEKRLNELIADYRSQTWEQEQRDRQKAIDAEMEAVRDSVEEKKAQIEQEYADKKAVEDAKLADTVSYYEAIKNVTQTNLDNMKAKYQEELDAFVAMNDGKIENAVEFANEYNRIMGQSGGQGRVEVRTGPITEAEYAARVAAGEKLPPLAVHDTGALFTEPHLVTRLRDMQPTGIIAKNVPEYLVPATSAPVDVGSITRAVVTAIREGLNGVRVMVGNEEVIAVVSRGQYDFYQTRR